MMAQDSSKHILIIGGGVFGASTAYHLLNPFDDDGSSTPFKVTLVDRSPLGQGIGASEDFNKIIRGDYSQRHYMDLAYEAINQWKAWNGPGQLLEGLYHNTGWVMLNKEGSDLSQRIRKCYEEWTRDPTKDLTMPEVRSNWNGILSSFSEDVYRTAYYNPDAGWAEAGTAVTRMIEAAQQKGLNLITGEVSQFAVGETGLRGVKLLNGTEVNADAVILATGAWTSVLMDGLESELNMPDDMKIEKQLTCAAVCVAHYKLDSGEREKYENMPVVVYGEDGEALPLSPEGYLKFTNSTSFKHEVMTSTGASISVPPSQDQRLTPETLKKETLQVIKGIMPSFTEGDRQPDLWRLCWDSVTPTQDQLICKHPHPRLNNLYLATGGSFHSYKFLPTIGKYVVNVLKGASNGADWDKKWGWKDVGVVTGRGAHEKVVPKRDLSSFE